MHLLLKSFDIIIKKKPAGYKHAYIKHFAGELLLSRNKKSSNSMITTDAFYVCNALMAWPETIWVTARLQIERSMRNNFYWLVSAIVLYIW